MQIKDSIAEQYCLDHKIQYEYMEELIEDKRSRKWQEAINSGLLINSLGCLVKYSGAATEVIVPEGVVNILEGAFKGNTELSRIVIPGSVRRIRSFSFESCSSLQEVIFGEGVTIIDSSAFFSCTSLSKIVIPVSVTSIGEYAFAGDNCIAQIVKGSMAEQYCMDNGISYEYISAAATKEVYSKEERCNLKSSESMRENGTGHEDVGVIKSDVVKQIPGNETDANNEELEHQRAEYDRLTSDHYAQLRIIEENRGWFGAQAKARKAAKARAEELRRQIEREFPEGRP